jgi:hypothetical protein
LLWGLLLLRWIDIGIAPFDFIVPASLQAMKI